MSDTQRTPAAHRPFTAADLFPRGPLARLGSRVLLFETIDSTSTHLLADAGDLPDGTVAVAEFQSGGRGRLGRRWEAPRGSSVLLSVLLHEPDGSLLIQHAPLLACVAACEAIEQSTACHPAVRWPNDLVVGGRKLGGVLAESIVARGARALVIGIGINCLQQRGHFPDDLRETATSLELESAGPVSRRAVAAALLARLDGRLVDDVRPDGWPKLRTAWRNRCVDFGQRVSLQYDGQSFSGTVLDISEDADLVVQLDHGGRRHFAAVTTTRAS